MAARGRRAKRRQTQHILFGILGLTFVLAILGAAGYHFLARESGPDKVTLCPAKGPKGHYVLLVDKTDPLNFTQKQAFSVLLDDLVRKRLPEGYLLSVFVLGEDFKATAEPLVELCNPGSGENKSVLTSNVDWARRDYEQKFIKPLMQQAEALQGSKPAKASPIFEMLQLVAINGFRRHDVKGERRLFLMSDMLHNNGSYSMYRAAPDYSSFADTDYGRKTRADLRDVEVELYYLINTPQFQTRRNQKFWEEYFDKSGARLVEVRPLEG
ncbi:hypothetical protein QTH90_15240 [Variovorax sp. J2P1-59]|uniref:hypothetical protein n=1 Tax=Variovorax flavidus TaxID=3053501 RepID=UPI002575BFE0|nr:hypothetical protein [Variovorax sp. J2P1-59]MDM0075756.1 hypothetical protein [Variovorax sp. J2P1-59]